MKCNKLSMINKWSKRWNLADKTDNVVAFKLLPCHKVFELL